MTWYARALFTLRIDIGLRLLSIGARLATLRFAAHETLSPNHFVISFSNAPIIRQSVELSQKD